MSEPVLVVHGVANREEGEFISQVRNLRESVGRQWNFLPVYWGDLGAEVLGLADTLPQVLTPRVRAAGELSAPELMKEILREFGQEKIVRTTTNPREVVTQAAADTIGQAAVVVRGGPVAQDTAAMQDGIREQWDHTQWLQWVQNQAILEAVGHAIGHAAQRYAQQPEVVTRGFITDVKEFAKSVLSALDEAMGAVVGEVAGTFNHYSRGLLIPGVGRFLGDVFVYQRHRADIQKRLWNVIEQYAPGYGTKDLPISVVSHSLGGVITFDAAVTGQPQLWVKAFVTFGSQSSFFHVLDPRGGALSIYTPAHPVTLPETIGRWTNLWEPTDPLAFVAGKVFRLHSGESPTDIEVPHLVSSGLWTHSAYWAHEKLIEEIRLILGG
jgi:hypothetical protein